MPPKPTSSYFSGRVHSVVFENESEAFYILRVVLDQECITSDLSSGTITLRGEIPGLQISVGLWFGFEGVWEDHPNHGRQVKVTRAPVLKDGWDKDTCAKILLSHGIGPSIVTSIKDHFGERMGNALLDLDEISKVPGMTDFLAGHIRDKWATARSHYLTLGFLSDLGLPQGKIRQVWSIFGDEAKEVLSKNPWALVQISGITFNDADTVATRLGLECSHKNPLRVEGAVLYASREGRGFGHLYSRTGELFQAVRDIDPFVTEKDIASAIKSLVSQKSLVVEREPSSGITAVYDPWLHKVESEAASMLMERFQNAKIKSDSSIRYAKALVSEDSCSLREAVLKTLARNSAAGGMTLSPKQTEGVLNAVVEPISVITGLPGSGKTSSLRTAVAIMQEAGMSLLLVAPTGIAAKRLASVTGLNASTIHRAFRSRGASRDQGREATYSGVVGESLTLSGSDGSDEVWGFSPGDPHPAEVVIIDESSMVDQHLLFRILHCTRSDARLVFVGDAAQLPSVGPGNVLRDLLASKLFPTVTLTEVFRQAETSPIIRAAHDVHAGRVPEAPVGTDFSLIHLTDEAQVASTIVTMATRLFEKRSNFQVLSPRHSGTIGVTALNTRLREAINPKQPTLQEIKLGSEVLREDDRVMVVKNDYTLGIYNGDVGKVASIDRKAKEIEVKIHGPPVLHVRIPFKSAGNLLRLAYAITAHRSQGQEYDVILLPLLPSFGLQLQRNLFYTAITRARKKVVLVGSAEAMAMAVANDKEGDRNTLFLHRLLRLASASNTTSDSAIS